MAQLNTLIFQQNFTSSSTISITHNGGSKFVNVKVIIANEYRSDLIDSVQITDQNSLTITLKSAQTGFVQVFDPDLILATESGATIGNTSNNYIFAYDTTTQNAGSLHASGTVTLTGGSSGSIDGITVNGVQIMSGAESFDIDLATTAKNVAENIGAFTSSPDYGASSSGSVITIYAAISGTGPNGFVVVSSTTTITSTDVNMSGGTVATANTFSPVFFNNSESNGWIHNTNTPILTCGADSRYIATVEFNTEKPGGGSPAVAMIAELNGSEIVGSHQGIDITSNNTTFSLSRSFLFNATAGDEFIVAFASSLSNVDIVPAPDPTGTVTAVASAVTIARLS